MMGGYLIIGDFQPSNLARVPYHHLPDGEVYTYKQSYAATFLASGLYRAVSMLTGMANTRMLTPEGTEDDRIGTWLLRKSLTGHYLPQSRA